MAPQVGALVVVFLILSTADAQQPDCYIPEGHTNGEPVGYYDPEPRSGYTTATISAVCLRTLYNSSPTARMAVRTANCLSPTPLYPPVQLFLRKGNHLHR